MNHAMRIELLQESIKVAATIKAVRPESFIELAKWYIEHTTALLAAAKAALQCVAVMTPFNEELSEVADRADGVRDQLRDAMARTPTTVVIAGVASS